MPVAITGGETLLIVVAAIFIALALLASMVVPRYRPGFPGERTGWFALGTLVVFAAMLTTVVVATGGEEGEHGEHGEAAATETQPGETTTGETTTGETTTGETTTGETTTGETTTGETTTGEGTTGETATEAEGGGDAAAGKTVFASAGCGGCHTLEAANSSGSVGPNLDDAKPDHDLVVDRVTHGSGAMPSFQGQLDEKQIEDVAAYVVASTQG